MVQQTAKVRNNPNYEIQKYINNILNHASNPYTTLIIT